MSVCGSERRHEAGAGLVVVPVVVTDAAHTQGKSVYQCELMVLM